MDKSQLFKKLEEEYYDYCRHNPSLSSIGACHTKFFKVIHHEYLIRNISFWYLQFKYNIITYHNDVKYPAHVMISFNENVRKALHFSSDENRIALAIYDTCVSYDDFYKEFIVDPYTKRQSSITKGNFITKLLVKLIGKIQCFLKKRKST